MKPSAANLRLDELVQAVAAGRVEPLYLLHGDRVLAEPAGLELARAIAARAGCEVDVQRRPAQLGPLLADLRTFSLFGSGKVVLAIETALLSSLEAAADLIDEAAEVLPLAQGAAGAGGAERRAARRLVRVLRLFDLDPGRAGAAELVAALPSWVLQGGGGWRRQNRQRPRGKRQVAELQDGLVELLELARQEGVEGWAESELAELGDLVDGGLPPGNTLLLVESHVAAEHPLVETLARRGALLRLGTVESERGGGWRGIDLLAAELERETGTSINADALSELARRTLRQTSGRGADGRVEADSTARLAAEYRKLAAMTGGDRIARELVAETVQDRGQEDVWGLLDAIGAGRGSEALQRLSRQLATADDALATRLSLFALLADFCRTLLAVGGMLEITGQPRGERSYPRFKERIAPALQAATGGPGANPLAGMHAFRLHRAYLAASRISGAFLARLPWRVLETELRLKGESASPDAALAALVVEVAAACR